LWGGGGCIIDNAGGHIDVGGGGGHVNGEGGHIDVGAGGHVGAGGGHVTVDAGCGVVVAMLSTMVVVVMSCSQGVSVWHVNSTTIKLTLWVMLGSSRVVVDVDGWWPLQPLTGDVVAGSWDGK